MVSYSLVLSVLAMSMTPLSVSGRRTSGSNAMAKEGDVLQPDKPTEIAAMWQSMPPPVLDNVKCRGGTFVFSDTEGLDLTLFLQGPLQEAFTYNAAPVNLTQKPGAYSGPSYTTSADTQPPFSSAKPFPGAFKRDGIGSDRSQGVSYLKGLRLKDGVCLAFLGDTLDAAHHPDRNHVMRTTLTLIYLKIVHPDRVVLILGNRDVNKMRLKSELLPNRDGMTPSAASLQVGPYYWTASPAKGETGLDAQQNSGGNDRVARLKNIFQPSMGASKTMENLQAELSLDENGVTNFVYNSVVHGIMEWYLDLAVVIAVAKLDQKVADGSDRNEYAVFAHGGMHPNLLKVSNPACLQKFTPGCAEFYYPTAETNLKTAAEGEATYFQFEGLPLRLDTQIADRRGNKGKKIPNLSLDRTYARVPEGQNSVEGWATKWYQWKQIIYKEWSRVTTEHDFYQRHGDFGGSSSTGYLCTTRPGATLMDMGLGTLGGTFRNAGFWQATPIVEFRWSVHLDMLEDSSFYQFEHEQAHDVDFGVKLGTVFGINRVFQGHFAENGKLTPEIYNYVSSKMGDGGSNGFFQSINVDVSFSYITVHPFSQPWKAIEGKANELKSYALFKTVLQTSNGNVDISGNIVYTDPKTAPPQQSSLEFKVDAEDVHAAAKGHDAVVKYIADKQARLVYGESKEENGKVLGLWQLSAEPADIQQKIDKQKHELRAYVIGHSFESGTGQSTHDLIKVNHRNQGGMPAGASWYYLVDETLEGFSMY